MELTWNDLHLVYLNYLKEQEKIKEIEKTIPKKEVYVFPNNSNLKRVYIPQKGKIEHSVSNILTDFSIKDLNISKAFTQQKLSDKENILLRGN